jgi:hypothetical protein
MFYIVHFFIKLRRWITEDKMGMTGKLSDRSSGYIHDTETGHLNKEARTMEQPEFVK